MMYVLLLPPTTVIIFIIISTIDDVWVETKLYIKRRKQKQKEGHVRNPKLKKGQPKTIIELYILLTY